MIKKGFSFSDGQFTLIFEIVIILVSVFLGFYLDNLRVRKENEEFKNELVRDMQIIINEEQDQIKKIKDLQLKCLEAAEKLIYNIQKLKSFTFLLQQKQALLFQFQIKNLDFQKAI